jgi:hypothetical protein
MDGDPPVNPLRELLFADLPPAAARSTFERGGHATRYLVDLAAAAEAGDAGIARAALSRVPPATRETRMHLQAWSLAGRAGIDPAAEGVSDGEVLGVVVDVGLDDGLDTLAGYLDGSARYLNHAGGAVVWEVPDPDVGRHVRALLDAATRIVESGGPLDGPRPGPPHTGHLVLSVLTRGGTYVAAGPAGPIAADPRGGPVLSAATALMGHLVERSLRDRPRG